MDHDAPAIDPAQARRLLLAIQAGDAIACAIPLTAIREELDRLGCPPALQRTIPVLKAASVAGILAGRRQPRLGRLTTSALVAYFLCALGAHARVRDPAWRWAAAAGMLGVTLVARRSFAAHPAPDAGTATEVIDLTTAEARGEEPTVDEEPAALTSGVDRP